MSQAWCWHYHMISIQGLPFTALAVYSNIYTNFCTSLCFDHIINLAIFNLSISPYASGLLHWPLGQPYGCPKASEVTLKDMGTISGYLTSRKKMWMCAYFLRCTAIYKWLIALHPEAYSGVHHTKAVSMKIQIQWKFLCCSYPNKFVNTSKINKTKYYW